MNAPDLGDLQRAASAYCQRVDEYYTAWARMRLLGGAADVTQQTAPHYLQQAHHAMMDAYSELRRLSLGAPRPDYIELAVAQIELERAQS